MSQAFAPRARIGCFGLIGAGMLLAFLTAAPASANGRVELAPYVEVQVRPAWFRRTSGTCPGAEIHRRSIGAVGQATCPGGENQPTYSH